MLSSIMVGKRFTLGHGIVVVSVVGIVVVGVVDVKR